MTTHSHPSDPTAATPLTEEAVLDAIRQIIDPELGVNVVDLGLICSVAIQGAHVVVTMTLTTPGCPMHDALVRGVRLAVLRLEAVETAEVKLVWEPAWTPERMAPHLR